MRGVALSLARWKGSPLRLTRVPPAGSSLLTAAASPSAHALNSAWALMFGMILRLAGLQGAERFDGRGGGARGSKARVRGYVALAEDPLTGFAGHPLIELDHTA